MVVAPNDEQPAARGLVDRLEPLLTAITRRQQQQVWRMAADGHLGTGNIADSIRRILSEKLNGPRRELAKRLFSDSWRPLLVSDPHLLLSDASMPGVFHAMDVGALWFALQHFGMKETAERVQQWLERECEMTPLDELIRAQPVQSMRQTVRSEAADLLSSLMDGDKGQRQEFLRFMNTWRAQELTEVLGLFDVPGMDTVDLRRLSWMVNSAQSVVEVLPQNAMAVEELNDAHAGDRLLEAAYTLSAGEAPDARALWPLLVVLHRTFRYGIASHVIPLLPANSRRVVGEALLGHAMTWARSINSALTNVLGEVHPTGYKPILVLASARAALALHLERLGQLMPLLQDNMLVEPAAREKLLSLMRTTGQSVVPALVEGVYVRLERYLGKSEELLDFVDLIWFGTFHPRLLRLTNPGVNPLNQAGSRQRRIVALCQDLFRRGGSNQVTDPAMLFDRSSRLFALAKAYGGRPHEWLLPPDRRLISVCLQVLDKIDLVADPLRALPLSLVAAVQEYSKTTQIDGMLALLCRKGEAARQRLRTIADAGGR
jgi:GNAT superfamily N-acetyltransferase